MKPNGIAIFVMEKAQENSDECGKTINKKTLASDPTIVQ